MPWPLVLATGESIDAASCASIQAGGRIAQELFFRAVLLVLLLALSSAAIILAAVVILRRSSPPGHSPEIHFDG